jgi:glutamine amidotransferase
MRDALDKLVLEQNSCNWYLCRNADDGNNSDEGNLEGLKWIDASVRKFDETKINHVTRLPHMDGMM